MIALSCPNCGAPDFEAVQGGRQRCTFCRTVYYQPGMVVAPDPDKPAPKTDRTATAMFVVFAIVAGLIVMWALAYSIIRDYRAAPSNVMQQAPRDFWNNPPMNK